jgi:PAS domain S-box-containing protein
MMDKEKRPYITPKLTKYSLSELPDHLQEAFECAQAVAKPHVVVDSERRYVSVSEAFARMVGYSATELIGKKYDQITSSNSVDIECASNAAKHVDEMDGLWLFDHRSGKKVLAHYHAWRSGAYWEADLEPLLVTA